MRCNSRNMDIVHYLRQVQAFAAGGITEDAHRRMFFAERSNTKDENPDRKGDG
jgi:hypothetical protein